MKEPLIIDYYTDILCVWAWISQRRVDELQKQLGDEIRLRHLYVDVFGDVPGKMSGQWAARDGFDGFTEHVRESASAYEDAPLNQRIWSEVRPATSANAHLVLKAVEIAEGAAASEQLALAVRRAFFMDAADIGKMSVLIELCDAKKLNMTNIQQSLDDGAAMALLMADYQGAKQQGIKGSPSYVIDNGRQTLYGNVGYRVLHANIEELLKLSESEASWC